MSGPTCGHLQAIKIIQECDSNFFCTFIRVLVSEIVVSHRNIQCRPIWVKSSSSSSSSSIGTTAPCGLWPVEQCPPIFSYLPPTPSIFSLPALEDLFLLPLSIFSWVFRFFPSSSWAKIFLGILSSSILSRWPNQLILCPFIHFTIFSPLLYELNILK